METVKRYFVRRELRALVLLMAGLAASLGYLVGYGGITPLVFLLIPLLSVFFLIRMARQVSAPLRDFFERYPASWERRVEEEFSASHPVCKVAGGEAHLLESCIICRQRRRLWLLPAGEIVRVGTDRQHTKLGDIRRISLSFEDRKPVRLEFTRRREAEKALQWFSQTLGERKVPEEAHW